MNKEITNKNIMKFKNNKIKNIIKNNKKNKQINKKKIYNKKKIFKYRNHEVLIFSKNLIF